jgi:competence protein ComEA
MPAMTRATLAILMSCAACVAVTATPSPTLSQPPPTAAAGAARDPFPDTTGRTVLLRACSDCHTAESVIQTMRTRQEWSDVIDQMAHFGAQASDQEYDQILAYLVRHFSPIKVNTATAKELEAALDVGAGVADAIVAFRADKGAFKSLEDVMKVPGLDAAKVEAVKGRLVY